MYNNVATRVLTGDVRLTYCNLVQPRVNPTDPSATPKYSVTILIPKSDIATYQNVLASIEAAAADAQGKLWNGVRPPVMPTPIHDGDGVRDNGTPYGEECRGHWVLTASSKQKPSVVHANDFNAELRKFNSELLPQDIYSGMYARVTMNFFGYNRAGKKSVGCGLGNIMKTREGEQLAGGASAESDFAGIAAGNQIAVGGIMPAAPNFAVPGYNPAPVFVPQPGAINPLTGQPYYGG